MIKVIVCYGEPDDVAEFDRHYFDVHVPLAKALPNLREYTVSSGPVTGTGERAPHLIASLTWDSPDAYDAAMGSPQGAAVADDLEELATGGWWTWQFEEKPADA
jgi:uncharacterized protein (TIGR02118 family)